MSALFPFIVSGLVVGSVYAIAAMGLVVTYRTTGLFNFAHGAVAMAVAYAFYELRTDLGVPTALAILISLVVVAPVTGAVMDRVLFRGLGDASQASKIVVSLGLLALLEGGAVAIFGGATKNVAPFLPQGTVRMGSVYVGYDQMITIALGLVTLAALTVFFRVSRTGLAMRAVVDNRVLTETAGFAAWRISMFTWALGVLLAGAAGILFSPLLGLDTSTLTLLIVQCFAAAVVGRLVDLPRTYVGALGLGIVANLLLKFLSHHPSLLNGLEPSLPFILLFGVLLFARSGRLLEIGVSAPWTGTLRERARSWWVLPPLLLVLTFLLPQSRVFSLGFGLVLACAFLSITVLTASTGLLSLTQAGLAGVGAFTYLHLTGSGHVPFLLALVLSGLVTVPLGVAIAIPALRLPGLFLALATFGFGELIDGLLFTSWKWFAGGGDGLRGSRPSLLRSDRAFVVFIVLVFSVFLLIIAAVRQRALGRALVALRDSPAGAESLGVNPLWPKLAVFSVSAFMAGVAGALYAGLIGAASSAYFSVFTSLTWVTVVVVGGIDSVYGAALGGLAFGFVPTLSAGGANTTITEWIGPAFGVGAILLAMQPGGVVGLVRRASGRKLIGIGG